MARRKRGFRRSAPDRGWIVGHFSANMSFPSGDPDANTIYRTLFDFADIDPEALTGRIEQDKSDWFVKRAILNIAASARLAGLDEGDVMRTFEWGVGTIGVENAASLVANDTPVFGAEAYNLWARQFQTGVQPAYHIPVLPYAAVEGTGDIRLAVTSATGSEAAGWTIMSPVWGPSLRAYDFTVSNAGLRNNQECGIAFTQSQSVTGLSWDEGDTLDVAVWYQILVQKRRT